MNTIYIDYPPTIYQTFKCIGKRKCVQILLNIWLGIKRNEFCSP